MAPDGHHEELKYSLPEICHEYGDNIHILSDPFLFSRLAQLCSPEVYQPQINQLIEQIYSSLLQYALNTYFPTELRQTPTRMVDLHPQEGVLKGPQFIRSTKVVSVNLARAGTLPSHICYDSLNHLFDPQGVRQDHISIARSTDAAEQVIGAEVSGHKIGGPIDDAFVIIPDPMGATGGTIARTLELYQSFGRARKWIALHAIITPEYIRRIQDHCPEVEVIACRLDRGLSPLDVLKTKPGSRWSEERGLNEKQYIVPGGGGLGEVLNNAYV